MSGVSHSTLEILIFLLPGFLAAEVFYSLSPHPRRTQFERVVQALLLTLLIQLSLWLCGFSLEWGTNEPIAIATEPGRALWSVVLAVIVGFALTLASHNDFPHRLLRHWKLITHTTHGSPWYGAFVTTDRFVAVSFRDGRKIQGWPLEWPDSPEKGHLVLEQAAWVVNDERIPMTGVEKTLVPVENIELVQFLYYEHEMDQPLLFPEENSIREKPDA